LIGAIIEDPAIRQQLQGARCPLAEVSRVRGLEDRADVSGKIKIDRMIAMKTLSLVFRLLIMNFP
jgi:hypothetical protein